MIYFNKWWNMNENTSLIIKRIIKILILAAIVIVVANLFVFLLPILLFLGVIYYLYRFYYGKNIKKEKTSKRDYDSVVEAEVIKEKFDKWI